MKERIKWSRDSDGDWSLSYDGHYFGMVCRGTPKCPNSRFLCPVAVWGNERYIHAKTTKEAKETLLGLAQGKLELKVVKK